MIIPIPESTVPPPEAGGLSVAPISFIQSGNSGAGTSGQIERSISIGFQFQTRHVMDTSQVLLFQDLWLNDLNRGTKEFEMAWISEHLTGSFTCKFVSPIRLSAKIPTKIRGGHPLVEVNMEFTAYRATS